MFSGASGNPSVPRWLGSLLFGMLFTPRSQNDKYVEQIRSSSGIAIFVSEVEDKTHWVEAGRCYERFALQSAALGIRNAMINPPVEVSALRPRFAAASPATGPGRAGLKPGNPTPPPSGNPISATEAPLQPVTQRRIYPKGADPLEGWGMPFEPGIL